MLDLQVGAGQVAMSLERPEEAVERFREALSRARVRDDPSAIADLGFDLAVAELQANQPEAALQVASDVTAELARRQVGPPPALRLAEAIALYRTGRLTAADAVAAQVEAAADKEAAARATFLRGLIADDTGNVAELRTAAGRIAGLPGDEHQADSGELSARMALRDGNARRARAEAERAADLRRELVDYRSLARSLALEARAAQLGGDTAAAADLYERAGRTAAAQADKSSAQRWLNQAISLSRDPALTRSARSALNALQKN